MFSVRFMNCKLMDGTNVCTSSRSACAFGWFVAFGCRQWCFLATYCPRILSKNSDRWLLWGRVGAPVSWPLISQRFQKQEQEQEQDTVCCDERYLGCPSFIHTMYVLVRSINRYDSGERKS